MISVIVPVYHVEILSLNRCLDSLISQSAEDIEILIVMDGEDKEVRKELESKFGYSSAIRLLTIEHQGVSAARNEGILQATGEYLAFVDADDWLEQDGLKKLLKSARNYRADIVMGEHVLDYGNHTTRHQYKESSCLYLKDINEFRKDVLKPQSGAGFAWGKLFSRKLLVEGGIFFDTRLSAAEDAEFVFRAAGKAHKICYIPDLVYHYCVNFNSAVRRFRSDYARRYIMAMDAVKFDIKGQNEEEQFLASYFSFVLYHLLLVVVNYSFHPNNPDSKRERIINFRKFVCTEPFAEALQHVRYQDFSKTRAFTLWCIVHHQYEVVSCIASFRHHQFKKFSGKG
ncbi:MAG: glycosyltransferase [Lachnospiraceae bacterium]|jgi:glycosyltransferase EpsJ|nr:glycosyltransferase [Lachnospiraceae bacterium]MCH4030049.1 glycosyltransferase [Lachnospiraceae bacterium]MCH4070291.1 glycosyltransferase [Lachnospiraceae bacterium]MCH4107803.1 glycosyltransferase [Lachnospiraceae bacterium]MCI1361500.1 glycosyltransferase [Lachnospiraceae bacterium]